MPGWSSTTTKGARLHNWWTGSSWSIDTGTGSNTSGDIHHDLVISRDGGLGTPRAAIWQGARNAAQQYRGSVGAPPPDADYDIAVETTIFPTPWSTLSTTHWPDGYDTRGRDTYSVNFHEFGQTVRHSMDGDFAHFLYDAIRFVYPRTHDPTDCRNTTNLGFAFNEGWAEFWATDWGARPPASPCDPTTNMELEGNVAAALYGLSQCRDVGRHGMVQVLQANPLAIHSFAEFASAFRRRFPVCHPEIVAVGDVIAHNAGEEFAVSAADRAAATLLKIREQAEVTAELRRSYDAAVAAAANLTRCDTVDRCEALFQAATGPALLRGRIAQSEQVSERLELDLGQLAEPEDEDGEAQRDPERGEDEADGREPVGLTNARMYARHLADQKRFDRQTLSIAIGATREALSAIGPFVDGDPTGMMAGYVADLTASLLQFETRQHSDLPPPEALQPPGAWFGETAGAIS
ncbi:MAG: hypothetical protein DLM67_01665 [Candidatus Nephthysia bennettiae]|uniref:Uncharacterized protein n=1 Tax=Candidatus Nephthysia bennettiae TaxID=3127016 RepID=A0A934K9W2_9BACT|nr:hypothetical protein [Candidatus Dormibacteraeota bacterium]MBJ7611530.1 hypothetical protein [Candidatus Dormibacteraeota bacterium]PZS00255.1 MAG: hypothetical protein DLM67_01665 [Candidatus Dormibacteraeota bacterium]